MKVTAQIIKGITKGSSSTFKVDTPRNLNTARATACYVGKMYPELGVKYSCKINYPTLEITITANKVSKNK